MEAEIHYEDFELLVHKVVHAFLRRKGISEQDYDEWHAQALLTFADCRVSFDEAKARFSTWLWHSIWHSLSDKLRRDAPHHCTLHYTEKGARNIYDESSVSGERDWQEFLDSLSADARTVVRITVDSAGLVDEREAKPGELRLRIYELLTGFGWGFERVIEAFLEIRTVLLS